MIKTWKGMLIKYHWEDLKVGVILNILCLRCNLITACCNKYSVEGFFLFDYLAPLKACKMSNVSRIRTEKYFFCDLNRLKGNPHVVVEFIK